MVLPTSGIVQAALALHHAHGVPWFDCLILAAAIEARCEVLYTEDFQDGQRFGDLTVVNPFRVGSGR